MFSPRIPAYRAYGFAVALVGACAVLAHVVDPHLSHANLSLLFLVAVLGSAYYGGLGPSLVASLLSFLVFNLIFTEPVLTLRVSERGDFNTLALFVGVALIGGHLAGRMHREVEERREAMRTLSRLNRFAGRLFAASGSAQVVSVLVEELAAARQGAAHLLVPEALGRPELDASAGAERPSPDRVANLLRVAGSADASHDGYTAIALPSERLQGAVALVEPPVVDARQRDLLQSMCGQASLALDRTLLEAELEQARVVSETEQLRSALLSSVSHDLRTPLASIIGSTSSLLEYGASFSDTDRRDLLATVLTEARRLDRYIQNLLDMTRLGQGSLTLRRDWVDVADIISSAAQRIRSGVGTVNIVVEVEPGLPLIRVHGVLIEQALVNLIDNAVKFSPAGAEIRVAARISADNLLLEVIDSGPGIPESERDKIFDMFYTVREHDMLHAQGTGLGLAICRGLVGAHGGFVSAHRGPAERGTVMRIALPITPEERAE